MATTRAAKESARRPHATRQDARILESLRTRLIEAPDSSMAELAAAAGVGMSAIYSRFGDRGSLLRRLADEGNAAFRDALTTAHARLDNGDDGWDVFESFLRTAGAPDLTVLTALTIGTFERTQHELSETRRLYDMGADLIARLRKAGVLRAGVTWDDIGKIEEALGGVRGDGPERTRALQQRVLDVILDGLRPGLTPLTGVATKQRDFYSAARRRRDG